MSDNKDKIQQLLEKKIKALNAAPDFKEYFKLMREINREFIGTWQFIEKLLEPDPVLAYKFLIESFGKKAELDKENNKLEKDKEETIEKFTKQVLDFFEKRDFEKTTQQLFYVLLGNVMEHVGQVETDINKFNLEADLYPKLKMPLSLAFFMFQNLAFGPVTTKINALSPEYLRKYCALVLGLWRTVFELMAYERHAAAHATEEQHATHQHNNNVANNGTQENQKEELRG